MKTTQSFFMAALALMMTACSNDDNDIARQPAKAEGIPFTATISLGESASTRALTENGTTIEATWATGEKVALIYTVSATTYVKEAEVTPQGDGTATISTTLEGSPADNTDVTIVYPASAVDETTKDVKTNLLASQNGLLTGTGSIAEKYELRKTTTPAKLKIDGTTASLKGTVSLTNQNAIFKLTLKDIEGTGNVSATSVIISDQTGTVTTVTPASATSEMYVALPTTATTLKFLVTGSDSKKYFNMASSLSLGASYYQSTVKLATVGDVILSTGKCAKAGTSGAVAMIAYLGNDAETSPTNTAFKNGLALALEDVSDKKIWCSQNASSTSVTCLPTQYSAAVTAKGDMAGIANTDALVNHTGHTHAAASAARDYNSGTHPAGTSVWFLPSAGQWEKMATAATGYANLQTNAGLQESDDYWSSTESDALIAWFVKSGYGYWYNVGKSTAVLVRACLAF